MSVIRSRVPRSAPVDVRGSLTHIDLRGPATWIVSAGVVIYLGLNGGGYDTTIWGGVGVLVWWAVVLVALVALDLVRTPSRLGWLALAALGGLAVWSAIGLIWSSSDERTLNEVGRVSTYLGVLLIAIAVTRRAYARELAGGIAAGIVVISAIALLSRLRPNWFPASANETSVLLPGARNRLSYPLDYWNALAAVTALGLPLLLSSASHAQTRWRQALSAALVPTLVLTLLLTFSRGGLIELGIALFIYLIVAPHRLRALVSIAVAAAGAAIVCVVALGDHDLHQGLDTPLAHHQGVTVLVVLLAVSAGVAAAQFMVATIAQRASFKPPSMPYRPIPAIATVLVAAVVAFFVFGGPHEVSRAWASFKRTQIAHNTDPGRLGNLSGNGRYQYWRNALKAMEHRPLTGIGAGTWEFWWTQHGRGATYAQNAHSLVFETLAENGIPGGVFVIVFLAAVIIATVRRAWQAIGDDEATLVAAAAACAAGAVALATDWSWQVAVVPVCVLALAGLALGSDARGLPPAARLRQAVLARLGLLALAAAALASIAIPLAMTSELRRSQAAFARGAIGEALQDARSATRLEPYAAMPLLQQALVLESAGHLAAAETAARQARRNDSADWREPLILARIQAERGEISASLASARVALMLNPSIGQYLR